jgi:flavorubredoxin
MKCHVLYQKSGHRWLMFGRDPDRPDSMIDTNQFAIEVDGKVMLLDPGGLEVFPAMMAALTEEVPVDRIAHLFISHQDPDVSSSLAVWRQVSRPDTKIYVSWMWTGFVHHYDAGAKFVAIPDAGMSVRLGPKADVQFIPAHYLHSPGNFSVYDPKARILFSGDIGAAVPVRPDDDVFVHDFDAHVGLMEPFHRRWMGSPPARDAWVRRVSALDVDILAPQHGMLMRGADVQRFLEWFGGLDIGSGVAAMG